MSPIFNYQARNTHNEEVKGKIEAQNPAQAAGILRSRGLLIIGIKSQNQDSLAAITNFLFGIKQDEIVNVTRQLSTMVTAGLPLIQALNILEQQSKPALAKLLGEIKADIEGGKTFAASLEKHAKVFSRVYIQLVRAGEAGGVLDEVLERLADNLEKDKEFRAKTQGALIYPIIVVVAMIIVAFVMMIFVIPKMTELYKDFGADLPFATQLLMDISAWVAKFWWLLIIGGIGGSFALKNWYKTDAGQRAIDSWQLKVPIFGQLKQKVILTDFARTLSLLLGAGISLLQGLEIVTDAITNRIYRDAMVDTSKQVEKGVALSQGISRYDFFPPLLYQMIAVGEQTGKLDDVLQKLAVYFQSESEHEVKNLTTAMEPIIMIVLGLGVGLMVIAIIMPIYNLTSQF
jgi:type IV pilus assembly protein PilC